MHSFDAALVRISSKGQIAIPKDIRLAAGLEEGSQVLLESDPRGGLFLHLVEHPICELFGSVKLPKAKPSAKKTDKAIMQAILLEDLHTRSKK